MGIKEIFSDFFIKGSPLDKKTLITDDDLKPAYKKQKAITSYLPWLDIIEENKILLEDAKTVAAVFEIKPIPTEARSESHLNAIRDSISSFITGSFEEHAVAPWVVSTYCWCDNNEFRGLTKADSTAKCITV